MAENELKELLDGFCLDICLYGSTRGQVCSEAYACRVREELKEELEEECPNDQEGE